MIRAQNGFASKFTEGLGWLALLIILGGCLLTFPVVAHGASPLAGKLIYLQGNVVVAAAGSQNWQKAEVNRNLFHGDAVQTGPDSRAAILCLDESQLKLNENTLLVIKNVAPSSRLGLEEIKPASAGEAPRSLYQVSKGEIWLRNNKEKFPFAVETPAVTAAIRGTEFNLRVSRDGASFLTLLGGSLQLVNDYGQVSLSPGEEGVARPGQAPTKRVIVQSADAVQWSLYYPGIFSFRDLPLRPPPGAVSTSTAPPPVANMVSRAVESYDRGNLAQAQTEAEAALKQDLGNAQSLTVLGWLSLQHQDPKEAETRFLQIRNPDDAALVGLALARYRLNNVSGAYRLLQEAQKRRQPTPQLATMFGFMALMVGKVGEATTTLQRVLQQWPGEIPARCLLAQIYLVQNHKGKAQAEAAQAFNQAGSSPLAQLTMALVKIASFDLPAATRYLQGALTVDPGFVTAYVYLAKVHLGGNYLNRAWATIQRALELAPREAEVLALAGFIRLAFRDYGAAKRFFDLAVAANPGLGEPHLGLGIYSFRYRDMNQGLFQMLTATLLEPRISLYQSELGKALYQVRSFDKALEVYDYAKTLDHNDPTPYLYKGIALTDLNRPAEAVQEINRAIALNDNRGVFRSRLMLDQDRAVSNYNLAKAYSELGLGTWAYSKAVSAVNKAPTNSSAYLFLAQSYISTTNRLGAGATSLLLYRLLSPANQNTFSLFNDYTPMFEMPYLRAQLEGGIGSWEERKSIQAYSAEVYGGLPGLAFDMFGSYDEDRGFRSHNGENKNDTVIGLLKWEPTVKHSFLFNYSYYDVERGDDRNLNDYGYNNLPYWRQNARLRTYELGYVYRHNPKFTLLAYYNYSSNDSRTNNYTYGSGQIPFTYPPTAIIPGLWYETNSGYSNYSFKDFYLQSISHEFNNFQIQNQIILGDHTVFGGFDYFSGHLKYHSNEQLQFFLKDYINLTTTWTFPTLPFLDTTFADPFVLPLNISSTGTSNLAYRPPDSSYTFYLMDYWNIRPNLMIQFGLFKDIAKSSRLGFATPIYANKWSPRLGINYQITKNHTLRLALQESVNTHYFYSPSLVPAEIASFPWQINADNGALVREAGFAWEAQWDPKTFSRLQLDAHRISIPMYEVSTTGLESRVYWMWKRYHASLVVNRILGRYFGLNLGVLAGKVDPNFAGSYDFKEYDAYAQLFFWHPSGLRAGINSVLVKQDLTNRGDNCFGLLNASLGYEFPGKRGLVTLDVTNLLNRHFFYQTEFVASEPFLPARRLMFKLALYF
jgi:tetratricopeptide (TPR) repeat protein